MITVRARVFAAMFLLPAMCVAGCDNEAGDVRADEDLAPPIPTPGGTTSTPDPSATTSILRSDIEQPELDEQPLVALEPLEVSIGFPEGGSSLDEEAVGRLEDLLASQQVADGGEIILRGHSDAGGSGEANLRASEQRARRVAQWLVDNGVAERRITVIAFGEQNPAEPNALPDGSPNQPGRAANRRVDITVGVDRDASSAEPLGDNAQ